MHRAPSKLIFVTLGLAQTLGCGPPASEWDDVEEMTGAPFVQTADNIIEPVERPDSLQIMTWNMKFGGARVDFFFDGWGDRVHMSEDEVLGHVADLCTVINEQQSDIVLAQEVDMESKRSGYVDMTAEILACTDMNYAVWVPNWKSRFIPEEGLGPMLAGQAVFSKYPLSGNSRIDLPQSSESSAVVNYFWLHRAIQVTSVDVGWDEPITLINNHPTAYALDGTKQIHLERILQAASDAPGPLVVGGDFNVPPPGTIRLDGFADFAETSTTGVSEVVYTTEELDAVAPFYEAYGAAIPLETYQAAQTEEEQAQFFSHSISGEVFWVVKLDFLFTNLTWSNGETMQSQGDGAVPSSLDLMTLSDHCPITATLSPEVAQ